MKKILISLAIVVTALPAAAIVTFLLTPFWRWLEATTQIESIGHSGPADWCFAAVYALILVAAFSTWLLTRTRREQIKS